MKKTRKIAAVAAAMALAATMTVPGIMMSASAADITINGISDTIAHTFEVYQIFTGDLAGGVFTNLTWGSGIESYDGTPVSSGDLVPSDTIDDITALTGTESAKARVIISKIVTSTTKACDDVESLSGTASITGLPDGYYLIKDITNLDDADDANSAFIIQVAGSDVSVRIKNEKPSVDKSVLDEPGDAEEGAANGWGESADHAINESFQFKLTATVPIGENYAAYDTYQLTFNDTMSSGVTFESIESVKISSATLSGTAEITLGATQYSNNATAGQAGLTWSLTIDDIKALVNADGADIFGKEEIKVEVIYNAHLNENAIVDTADRTGGTAANTNCNKVDLQYSNNPDSTGTGTSDLGRTPEDYVWVFTYEVDNTKYKVSVADGNELQGAGFTLYSDSAMTQAIKLIENNDGTYTVAAADATTGFVTEMVSAADGKFNIKGLDAGTYYLRETTVPQDYNAAADITIEIGATHKEQADGTVNLTLTGIDNGVENQIVDTKNNSLPSTGGMGTTLFIVCGSLTAAAAGVYLVSKKRAKDESEE